MIFKDALLFAHHVNEFDTGERDAGSGFGLETKHGACAATDATMILLNVIVHIFAGENYNRVSSLSEPALSITLQDSGGIGLTAIPGQSLAQKAFGCR